MLDVCSKGEDVCIREPNPELNPYPVLALAGVCMRLLLLSQHHWFHSCCVPVPWPGYGVLMAGFSPLWNEEFGYGGMLGNAGDGGC